MDAAQGVVWLLSTLPGRRPHPPPGTFTEVLNSPRRPGPPEAGPKCKVSGVDRPSPVDKPSPSQAYSSNACNPGRSVVATNTTRWLGAQDDRLLGCSPGTPRSRRGGWGMRPVLWTVWGRDWVPGVTGLSVSDGAGGQSLLGVGGGAGIRAVAS